MFIRFRAMEIGRGQSKRRGRWTGTIAARDRFGESRDAGTADFSADHANRVIDREEILMPAVFGAEEEIADADVRSAGNGKLADNSAGETEAVAGGVVHFPFPGGGAQFFSAQETDNRICRDGSKQNYQQQDQINDGRQIIGPKLLAQIYWPCVVGAGPVGTSYLIP
jgi:hypothetical protein